MPETLIINKIVNGYTVSSRWTTGSESTIHFKDMPQLVKHLDDCFAKPLKDLITYEKVLKDVDPKLPKQ